MTRILLCATLAAASLLAQTKQTPPAAVQVAGRGLLRDVKELADTSFTSWYPLYAPLTERVAFWEGRLSSREGRENGYAIFRADGQMAEFNTKGSSPTQKLLRMDFGGAVRISRFGPHYMAAISARGGRVASIGQFPKPMIDHQTGMPFNFGQMIGGTRDGATFTPEGIDPWRIRQWASEESAFSEYVINYDRWFELPKAPAGPGNPVGQINFLMDPNPYDTGKGGATADGEGQNSTESFTLAMPGWKIWDQLGPNDPVNTNKGFKSGCGGQAFLTLFNWHDINVTPNLLAGDPSQSSYPQTSVAMHLNDLRDWLGTFESFNDLGATTPWNMVEGVDYARFRLNHYADWVMMFGGTAVTDLMGKMVRDMVAIYGKPMIIGYMSDFHYDVVNEVKAVNGARQFHIDADGGKWITEGDLFFVGGAFDFRSVGNAAGYNHGFEHGLNGWRYATTGAGGSVQEKLRETDAAQGTAYARLRVGGSKPSRLWKRVNLIGTGVTHIEVKLRVRTISPVTVSISARDTMGKPEADLPNGPILGGTVVTTYPDKEWHDVMFTLPSTAAFNFEVQVTSPSGGEAVADVDVLDVRPVFKQQPPPKEPCIKGKPGLDAGCDM